MGYRQAGKSTFIASALDLDTIDEGGSSSHLRQYRVDDEDVMIKISERSIDFDPKGEVATERAAADWVAPPLQIDGAIVLYDITSKRSLAAVPILLRTYHEAGVPLLLVGTKNDVDDASKRLNSRVIQQKARLIIDGLTVFQSSVVSPESAKRCVDLLVRDLTHRRQDEDRRSSVRSIEERQYTQALKRQQKNQLRASESGRQAVQREEKSLPALPQLALSKHKHRPSVFLDENSSDESSDGSESYFGDPVPDGAMMKQRQSRRASSPTVPEVRSPVGTALVGSPLSPEDQHTSPGADINISAFYQEDDTSIFSPEEISPSDMPPNPKMETASLLSFATREPPGIEECTLDELVDRLLVSTTPEEDSKFAYRFLTLYRFFASPLQLLNNVIKHCFAPYGEAAMDAMGAIDGHVFQILYLWVHQYPNDFALEPMSNRLLQFLDALVDEDEPFPAARRIRDAVGAVSPTNDVHWGVLTPEDTFAHSDPSSPDTLETPPISAENSTSSLPSTKQALNSESDLSVVFQTSRSSSTLTAMGPYDIQRDGKGPHNASQVSQRAQRLAATLVPKKGQPFGKPQWHLFMQQPEESIARELTRIDWILFSAATPRDIFRHATMSEKERARCPAMKNVKRMVQHFNHVAQWTANLILVRDKPKHRALVYEKLIKVARELRKLNNYSSLGALVAGMNELSIIRLGVTHSMVPPATMRDFKRLDVLMSVRQGHSSYRIAWEHTSNARIPFLPVHVRDLYLGEKGNKTYNPVTERVSDSSMPLINWSKFDMLGSILQEFQTALSTPYPPFPANEDMRNLLLRVRLKNSDELYDRSKEVEPSPSEANSGKKRELNDNFKKLWLV